jgi:hypothetical protein
MQVLALSATATTGLFTLIGTVVGAVIGGSLTLTLEILRRRWHTRDETEGAVRERIFALRAERKDVYSQLLAKGNELGYVAAALGLSVKKDEIENKDQGTPKSLEEQVLNYMTKLFTAENPLREFENLRALVEML